MNKSLFLWFILFFTELAYAKKSETYTCKKIVYLEDGKADGAGTVLNVDKHLEFQGADIFQKYSLDIAGNLYTLTLTQNQDRNQTKDSFESLSCDNYYNCTGHKIKYKQSGDSKKTNLVIKPTGGVVEAAFGERVIFQFKQIPQGFSFKSIKYYLDASLFVGTELSCQN